MTQKIQTEILNADRIARLIPHHGDMCLVHEVRHHDEHSIVCLAISHRFNSNPLRENGVLHAVCGVEYAAQAMAIHGALVSETGNKPPRSGRLAGVRALELQVLRLDDLESDLEICATQIMGDANSMVYKFAITAGARNLLKGKATVVLMP